MLVFGFAKLYNNRDEPVPQMLSHTLPNIMKDGCLWETTL